MEEIFYEDILETFLFCFIAAFGIIQIMVAKRGWHGLSIYGGRVRPVINYILGAAFFVFAYVWYFSNPLHRNVRNIEAFMSLLCLVLGILAAGAATALLSSLAEVLRRRFGRGRKGGRKDPGFILERIDLPAGSALLSTIWGERGENLVVIAEPGRGSENLMRGIFTTLPQGHGMLSLHPSQSIDDPGAGDYGAAEADIRLLLSQAERERGVDTKGEVFLGIGWGGNALHLLGPDLEIAYGPSGRLLVAPVVPDCEQGFAGDALFSDTPLDILRTLSARRPWKEEGFGRIVRMWLPILVACVVLATAVTVGFDVRWKFFSGPMTGLLLSLWVTYFIARWRGAARDEGGEKRLVARLCALSAQNVGVPFTVILTSEDDAAPESLPTQVGPIGNLARLELWENVLRGKFMLEEGTPSRLAALIWEGKPGDE